MITVTGNNIFSQRSLSRRPRLAQRSLFKMQGDEVDESVTSKYNLAL